LTTLTKIFIILLVILSLVSNAAFIVYINKEDIQKDSLTKVQAQLTAKTTSEQNLQAQLSAAQLNLQNAQNQANAAANAASNEMINVQKQLSQLQVQLAEASSKSAQQALDVSRLTEALNATQAQATKGSEEIARLRGDNDRLVKQSADLNGSVSDLTNKLDVTERERRLLAEQLTQVKGENQRLGMIIKGAQLSPQQQEVVANRGGPSINGVVRDVRQIAGQQYATISVGAADAVTRGMEFKVIDRATGSFLGTLVVDTVEPNESTGRLSGPKVSMIKPGVEVRTQL